MPSIKYSSIKLHVTTVLSIPTTWRNAPMFLFYLVIGALQMFFDDDDDDDHRYDRNNDVTEP